jgi:hypothetical protein
MIERYSKGIISVLVFAFAAIALFFGGSIFGFHVTADFQAKVIALIPLGASVVAVIGIKNATEDAIDKAVMQLVLGLLSVAQFFAQIPSDLGVKIGAFVYAAVAAYFVWKKSNGENVSREAVGAGTPPSAVPPLRR